MHGSNTVGSQLAPDLLEAYGKSVGLPDTTREPGANLEEQTLTMRSGESARKIVAEVQAHGSATAFTSLLAKKADIGMASRAAQDPEVKAIKDAGLGDLRDTSNEHVISLDGVLVIVHRDNPVQALTLAQVADLFTAKTTNWSAVGGPDRSVSVYSRDEKSGTFDTFRALALKGAKPMAGARLFELSDDLSDAVAADPGGIGFVGFAYLRSARAMTIAGECGLPAPPREFLVKTEEYPLSRRLYFYSMNDASPLVRDFLVFTASAAAQLVVTNAGFINLLPDLAEADDTADRIRASRGSPPSRRRRKSPNSRTHCEARAGFRRHSASSGIRRRWSARRG